MYWRVSTTEAAARGNSAMETGNHSKRQWKAESISKIGWVRKA